MPKHIKDVHTEHCCIHHGCKYGDVDTCTVTSGISPQSYPCEFCYDEIESNFSGVNPHGSLSDLIG